jgi:tRNA(fMet)-specific endonuclease VapC
MQMTGSKCLLDTNVIIEAFKSNGNIADTLDAFEMVYVSVTVIGELLYGAYKSSNTAKHLLQVESFISNCTVVNTDAATSNIYGRIKVALYLKGRPIPENDIWIAATALQHDLPLLTTDNHFKEIDEVKLVNK